MVEIEQWLRSMKPDQCFTKRMRIIAPTCYGACEDEVRGIQREITDIFGGATTFPAEGSWVNATGIAEVEPVRVIEVAYSRVCVEELQRVHSVITKYAKDRYQWGISFDVNGDFYIIPTSHMLRVPSLPPP